MCQESVNVDIAGGYDGIEIIPKSYGSDECGCVLKIRLKVLPKGCRDGGCQSLSRLHYFLTDILTQIWQTLHNTSYSGLGKYFQFKLSQQI